MDFSMLYSGEKEKNEGLCKTRRKNMKREKRKRFTALIMAWMMLLTMTSWDSMSMTVQAEGSSDEQSVYVQDDVSGNEGISSGDALEDENTEIADVSGGNVTIIEYTSENTETSPFTGYLCNKEEYDAYIAQEVDTSALEQNQQVKTETIGEALSDLSQMAEGENCYAVIFANLGTGKYENIQIPACLKGVVLDGYTEWIDSSSCQVTTVYVESIVFETDKTELCFFGADIFVEGKNDIINVCNLNNSKDNRIIFNGFYTMGNFVAEDAENLVVEIIDSASVGNISGVEEMRFAKGDIANNSYLWISDGTNTCINNISFADNNTRAQISINNGWNEESDQVVVDDNKMLKLNGEIKPFSDNANNKVNFIYEDIYSGNTKQPEVGQKVISLSEEYAEKNAKYLMIGDLIYFTLLLACEQQLHTYNRFMKKFSGITKINDTEIHSDCYYYCRRYCDNTILDLSKLTRIVVDPLVSAGKVKYESFGNSHLYYCTDVNIMMDAYKESLNRDLFELLKGPALSESDLIKIDPEKDELDINRVNYKIVKL